MPPYPQHYFDVVVCNNIWEHVPDPIRLLDAVTNILRPEGHLLISTPSRFRLDNLMNLVRGRRIKFMAPSHVTEYTVGQLAEQLNFRGYEVVKLAAPRATHGRTLKSFLRTTILRRLAAMALGVARVPAVSLESTVFCLARKRVVTGC
jgi:SAM-dependent methyltransferase